MAAIRVQRRTLVAAAVAAFSLSATPAGAEKYLFDILFGGNRLNREAVQPRQQPKTVEQTPPRAAVATPKISAPTYYDYQPEPLAKLNIGDLLDSLEATSEKADPLFKKAVKQLDGFDLLAEKKILKALIEHYSKRPEFIWVDREELNERAHSVLEVLANASEFGLTETDYVVNPPAGMATLGSADQKLAALARFELALSARALRYARDAHSGRVNPNKLSGYHDFPAKRLEEQRVLQILARTREPARYLLALHPRNEQYAALRQELKTLRTSAEREIVVSPETFVRPGTSHSEFPKILQILLRDADAEFLAEYGELLEAHKGSETYAPELVPMVKAAQRNHGLNPDGIIGQQTVRAVAGESKAARIEKVLLAMERLRWHPSHLGSTRIMINVPAFNASFIENEEERLSMRVVAGTASNQSNFFYDEVEYVEYNPYWGVPRSILVNEKLPRLIQDPGYLDRAGYEVVDRRGRRVSSASINWSAYGANIPYSVRQKPGPSNALGELKIMFPNKHDIYMHDTPAKNLFSRDTRAFSHGCIRLEAPRAMAAAVLGVSEEEIGRRIAERRNARQDVPVKVPVYVGYFTAWPDAAGAKISYHPDVYKRDSHLRSALSKVEKLRAAAS